MLWLQEYSKTKEKERKKELSRGQNGVENIIQIYTGPPPPKSNKLPETVNVN